MKQIPLLFMSDSPALPTGLARITKDLAMQTASLPQFRVGTFGRGVRSSSKLPFPQYVYDESDQWGEAHIENVWEDFAGRDQGVIFTIWDPSRLGWFAKPRMGDRLQKFLESNRFHKWGYIPVDSYGVGGKLTSQVRDTLSGYHRLLAYTLFGKDVLESTTGKPFDWIPHGYNHNVFQPRDRVASRMAIHVDDHHTLVGCVMTNQSRKDWGTAFGAIARLKNQIPDLIFWAHTDVTLRHWNIMALMDDFGLTDSTILTFNGQYSSEQLSYCYSACDITVLPSLGEGFGYPIIESLACGVPCIHGDFGGGAELIPDRSWRIPSVAERLDGPWNNVRPVWNPVTWADTMYDVIASSRNGVMQDLCTGAVEHLRWDNLWPASWKKWILEGA